MQIVHLKNTAFTLLEILLSAIIFFICVGGVFATLNAVRQPVIQKETALSATVFGQQVLESLRSQVDASTFYNSCAVTNTNNTCGDFSLSLGQHQVTLPQAQNPINWPSAAMLNNNNGVLSYSVTCPDGTTNYGTATCNADSARQVSLNINWPDAQ